MASWENKTDYAIKFVERNDSWAKFSALLGDSCLWGIYDDDLGASAGETDRERLGLKHEHQRWDRDQYIGGVPKDSPSMIDYLCGNYSYDKIPYYVPDELISIATHLITGGWFDGIVHFAFTILGFDLPKTNIKIQQVDGSDNFDYDSIMVYTYLFKKHTEQKQNLIHNFLKKIGFIIIPQIIFSFQQMMLKQ